MMRRRIRGLLTTAAVWGVSLSAVGTAFILGGLATGLIPPAPGIGPAEWIAIAARVAVRDFVVGGVAGAAFATLLTGAERRRTLETLSLSRVATWGFIAAAVPIGLVGIFTSALIPAASLVAGTIASGLLGAGLAVATVRLARRSVAYVPLDAA